jgi:hypothetical protein
LPENVSVAKLRVLLRERPAEMSLTTVGTFVSKGLELYSFVPSFAFEQALLPILDGPVSQIKRSDFVTDPERRKVISWLLRRHFERYLRYDPGNSPIPSPLEWK